MNPTTLTVSVLALSLWSGMAEAQTDVATSWQDLYAPYVSGAPLGEPLAGFGEGQTSLLTCPSQVGRRCLSLPQRTGVVTGIRSS